ncbi:MAG: flagellin lysine-N-methylase [Clostridia bacterium]|nr:flagellin lysine-N-methylase [Clostridia bacterium]
MKTYAPNYYTDFKCIADLCKHSCCIGWDVYLDEDTLKKYQAEEGALGERIRASLCEKEDGVCFAMRENGNCPFLNGKGLCDIILEKGEDRISEICREHPRFYNCFSDRYEVGLGLSCEEAARIMLSQEEKTELCLLSEDDEEEDLLWEEEAYVLSKRQQLFDLIQDRSLSLDERVRLLLIESGAQAPSHAPSEWAEQLSRLERFDPAWDQRLAELSALTVEPSFSEYDRAFEKLLLYFLYRHVSGAADEADLAARVSFSVFGFRIIRALCAVQNTKQGCSFEDLCELARAYSAEIEYSEDNTSELIALFAELDSY